MTRDEIAQMMQDSSGMDWGTEAHFQRFATLVAQAEREACADICDQHATCEGTAQLCAAAIRSRK